MRTYSLMHRNRGRGQLYTITVPAFIGHLCIEAGIRTFTCEPTPEGILFRPVFAPPDQSIEPPAWLRPKENHA